MKINEVKKLIERTFKKHGLSNSHSKLCSDALLNAELVGAPSHGLSRVSSYCLRIRKKVINPKPKIKVKKLSSSITSIDADNAVGFVGANNVLQIAEAQALLSALGKTTDGTDKKVAILGSGVNKLSTSTLNTNKTNNYGYLYFDSSQHIQIDGPKLWLLLILLLYVLQDD